LETLDHSLTQFGHGYTSQVESGKRLEDAARQKTGILDPDLKKPGARKAENADFAVAIKKGKAQANGLVSNVLFNLCKSGNVTAIIWYEKTRRGLDT